MKKVLGLMTGLFVFAAINVWAGLFEIGPIIVTRTNSTEGSLTITGALSGTTVGHTNWVSFTTTSTNGFNRRNFQPDPVTNDSWVNTTWNPYFTGVFIINVTASDDLSGFVTASTTVTVTRATFGKVNSIQYSSAPYNAAGGWTNVNTTLNTGVSLNDIGLNLDVSGVGSLGCNLLNVTNLSDPTMTSEQQDIAYTDTVRYSPAGTPYRFDVNLHARPRGFMGMGEIKKWIWTPDATNSPDGSGNLVVDITSCSPWRSTYSNALQSHVGFAPLFATNSGMPTGMIMCTSAHYMDVTPTNSMGAAGGARCGLYVKGHTGTNSYLKTFLSDTFLQQQYQLTSVNDATNVMAGFAQHFNADDVSTSSVAEVTASFTRIIGGTNIIYDYNSDGVGDSGYEVRFDFTFQSAVAAQMGMAVTNAPSVPIISASKGTHINNVRITWNSVSNAASYEVWRNTADATSSATKFDTEPTSASFDDTNASVGVVYYYWVKAKNPVGTSDFSSSDSGYAMNIALAADFDGDGLADPAVYNTNGTWKLKLSTAGYALVPLTGFLGGQECTALAADFDGDAKADPAIYNAASELWVIMLSLLDYQAATFIRSFGGIGWEALAGDFDGDRLADPAIYEAASGTWKVKLSTAGYQIITSSGSLGETGWMAIAADFDGDGKVDPTIYKASAGTWIVLMSKYNYAVALLDPGFLGSAGYTGLAADFDNDGYADPAVAQTTNGYWKIKLSSGNYSLVNLPGFLGE